MSHEERKKKKEKKKRKNGEAQHERTTNIQNHAPRHYSGFLCAVVVWKNEHEPLKVTPWSQRNLCLVTLPIRTLKQPRGS